MRSWCLWQICTCRIVRSEEWCPGPQRPTTGVYGEGQEYRDVSTIFLSSGTENMELYSHKGINLLMSQATKSILNSPSDGTLMK
ncbi:uncharacterized protein LOC116541002 isoform X3 [Sapajus apella]|uniref:Uncharacterized protein LOC116541002 isoform X3 n=1 Tax=Sapajus apella TaxID=9515 RepID=A0A6J3GS91_SAPAP|nr:uncharacterized protein LOC116541002 isoform X3 [Sapajus apella]